MSILESSDDARLLKPMLPAMLQVCGRAVSLGDEETAKLGCGILDDCVESPAGVVHPHLAPTPALTPALAPEPSPDPNPNPAPIPRLPLPRSTRTWLPSWPSRRTRPSVAASKRKRAPSALNLLAPPPIPPIFRDLSPQVRLRAQPARDGRSAQAQARRQAAARPPSGAHALRDLRRGGGTRRGRRRAQPAQARRTGPLHLLWRHLLWPCSLWLHLLWLYLLWPYLLWLHLLWLYLLWPYLLWLY